MDDKANRIARAALIVSIFSLLLTLVMAIKEYREEVEVIIDGLYVESTEGNEILLNAEVIVANTSQSTTSLIETSAFLDGDVIEAESTTGIPLTLISGYAEKVNIQFRIALTDEQLVEWEGGNALSEVLDTDFVSIRFKSAKNKIHSSSYKLDGIKVE